MSLPLIAFLSLAVPGLLLQCLLGAVLAWKRPISAVMPLLLPGLLLFAGAAASAWQMDQLYQLCQQSLDDPSLAVIALGGRHVAWLPITLGGWTAALLLLPTLIGAAVGALRVKLPEDSRRRPWMPALVTALAAFPGPVVLGMGLIAQQAPLWILGPPALLLPVLLLPGLIALSGGATQAIGASGLMLALLGTLIGAWGVGMTLPATDLEAMPHQLSALQQAFGPLSLGIAASAVAVLIGWMSVQGGASSLKVVGAPAGAALLALLIGLPLAGFGVRQIQVGRLAGSYPLTLTVVSAEMGLPEQGGGLPGRTLVVSKYIPRWLVRGPEGVEASKLEGELLDLGPSLRRGDGLMLPLDMGMEDVYLMLSGADVGEVALVGCWKMSRAWLIRASRDPLIATLSCGSRPLHLRLGLSAPPEQTIILLKNREVDIDVEIHKTADLPMITVPILLRAQVDATVADLHALLARHRSDQPVYLGYGVQLDGSDLPVGVEP